jgi:hypothetical protein
MDLLESKPNPGWLRKRLLEAGGLAFRLPLERLFDLIKLGFRNLTARQS